MRKHPGKALPQRSLFHYVILPQRNKYFVTARISKNKQYFIAGTDIQSFLLAKGLLPPGDISRCSLHAWLCCSHLMRFSADTISSTPLLSPSRPLLSQNCPGERGLSALCVHKQINKQANKRVCAPMCAHAHSRVYFISHIEEKRIIYDLIMMCSPSKTFSALIYCSL